MSDAELIQKFLDGDVHAFNTLIWRWEKRVYNFILRYVGDPESAKEICQKTFIRVYRKLDRLRDHRKFSTWLYQIAINMCRDEVKKSKRSLLSLEEAEANNNGVHIQVSKMVDASSRPDRHVQNMDLAQLLNRALQAIPEEQRLVIIMKEYQGLKFTEIAQILHISLSTAKSRMYYGLSALRKIFKKWNINEEMLNYEV